MRCVSEATRGSTTSAAASARRQPREEGVYLSVCVGNLWYVQDGGGSSRQSVMVTGLHV